MAIDNEDARTRQHAFPVISDVELIRGLNSTLFEMVNNIIGLHAQMNSPSSRVVTDIGETERLRALSAEVNRLHEAILEVSTEWRSLLTNARALDAERRRRPRARR